MMKTPIFLLFSSIILAIMTNNLVKSDQTIYKSLPRPGRASRSADDFENFFLKASKSVPRIGRRDYDMNANYYAGSYGYYNPKVPYPKVMKKMDSPLKGFIWSDIADKVEYYPEILISPGMFSNDGLKQVDNYDFLFEDKRIKNPKMNEQTKEITEYRLQPES